MLERNVNPNVVFSRESSNRRDVGTIGLVALLAFEPCFRTNVQMPYMY